MAAAFLMLLPVVLALSLPAAAVEPDEILPDPRLEARARDISAGLRCLVCQNQSIDDSHAPLARDLRVLVRERLKAGDSNAAVVDYVVQRYGEFVLLKPPFNLATVLLWLAPLLLLASAGWLALRHLRGGNRTGATASTEPPLTDEETRRLAELLKKDA